MNKNNEALNIIKIEEITEKLKGKSKKTLNNYFLL
jgi:hypothetical protein